MDGDESEEEEEEEEDTYEGQLRFLSHATQEDLDRDLIIAAFDGNESRMGMLLAAGANANYQEPDDTLIKGSRPLLLVLHREDSIENFVKELLHRGADVNLKGDHDYHRE